MNEMFLEVLTVCNNIVAIAEFWFCPQQPSEIKNTSFTFLSFRLTRNLYTVVRRPIETGRVRAEEWTHFDKRVKIQPILDFTKHVIN